jgi:hypothetical protein
MASKAIHRFDRLHPAQLLWAVKATVSRLQPGNTRPRLNELSLQSMMNRRPNYQSRQIAGALYTTDQREWLPISK